MVDSCGFWAPESKESKAFKRLKELEATGVIKLLEISSATDKEQDQIGTPPAIRKQSSNCIIAPFECSAYEERQIKKDIRNALFKNKLQLTVSDEVDIKNIYTAWYFRYFYFVTYDKRHILSKANIIWDKFRVRCVTPAECLNSILKMQKEVI